MYRVANAAVRPWPFPHICIENIFPADFYAEIRRHMIDDAGYRRLSDTGRVDPAQYSDARFCLFPSELAAAATGDGEKAFWSELFHCFGEADFTHVWLTLFREAINRKMEDLPHAILGSRSAADVKLYNEIFLMRDRTSYSLGPHTDTPRKLVSVLFYLPEDDGQSDLGTSIYLPKQRDFTCTGGPHYPFDRFDRVATMAYRPNTLVAFPQTRTSFHGVEPVTRPGAQRDLLLFDLKVKPR
jgi:hypothetical protein